MRGSEENFQLTQNFLGYISKPEITNVKSNFLVKGSKNVLVDYANRIISRNGYTLFGAAASANSSGIKSSYEWNTSSAKQFPLRVWGSVIEFYWNSTWNTLKSGLSTPYLQFTKVFDVNEQEDVLIWVMADANYYKWSGGACKIASATGTTITKQGVLTSKVTIAFVAGTAGTVAPTITDSANGFVTAGFAAGDTLSVSGSSANSRNFTIGSVAAGTITLIMTDVLTSEVAGPSITVHNGEATWASSRFLTTGQTLGTCTISNASPGVITLAAHGLLANDTVRFTTTGGLPTGLSPNVDYYVISAGLATNSFEVSATQGGAAINTSSAGSGVHTLLKTTRKVTYSGTDYTYTGGESTDTLTGLTSFPAVVIGDPIWQAVSTIPLPTSITTSYANFKPDLCGVQLNQLILASTKSMMVFSSSTGFNTTVSGDGYYNFTITSPRVPGGPWQKAVNDYVTCIIPIDNTTQSINSLMIGSGVNSFYHIFFQLSQDNTAELVNLVRLKTASGSGLISKDAFTTIKNSTVYITREPSLDTIAALETHDKADIPFSDLIKTDFDAYDFTNAHVKYWKRAIYIALPANGVILIYDLMRKLWQPPQTISISRFAIISDNLYGHSSVGNESYKLFSGIDDNGVPIFQVARFAYNNGGRRDLIKNMTQYWSDGYITPNALLNMNVYFGFNGIQGKKVMTISGGDTKITNPVGGSPLGDEPLGVTPIGGDNLDPLTGLPGTNATFVRFWQEDTMSRVDYNEAFVEYTMNTLDAQFAIVAHGSNQEVVETAAISHKK